MPESAFPALRFLLLTCALSAGVAAAQGETSGSSTKGASVSSPSLPAGQPVTAQPQTVVVQAGDTAYNLARRAGIPVEALLSLNGLSSPDLRVGQVLRLREVPVTHVVQPGETLYALARQYAVSVDVLLGLNSLAPEAKIAVGQVLKLPAVAAQKSSGAQPSAVHPASVQATQAPAVGNAPQVSLTGVLGAPPAPLASPLPGDWRGTAMALLGTPYVLGGTTLSGLDCSGFVLQVFTPLGVKLPRVSADQATAGVPVEVSELQPGDLVFFDTAGSGRVTHVGIYLGEDQFVNANSYKGEVTVDRLLSDRYWAPRYLGARRVMGSVVAQQPARR
ncbi:peptidase [Deinococcus malanensis]|uniref:Peptidase n=1 Tax=Deinococcus malanensis TaxID=1706855 RepID=A0ABQ2EUZ3_9DEIO|nr:C40 family peptidase [Deinococcus malanensis]GGK22087.1 peptidase [Deinococcus malanensis]